MALVHFKAECNMVPVRRDCPGLIMLSFVVLFVPSPSLAQGVLEQCPAGFRYVGTLKGTGSFVEPLDKTLEIKLPANATIDTSYQQTEVVAHGGKAASWNLRSQNIPKGIHIVPYGQDMNGKAWGVSDPSLKTVPQTEGKTRYVFAMRLHCTVDEYARQFGGCAVNADICYKPQQ